MKIKPSPTINVSATSGSVAAAFISASISIIILGIMTFLRTGLPWLEVYKPAAVYSGIFLYSEIAWPVLWVGLFFAL